MVHSSFAAVGVGVESRLVLAARGTPDQDVERGEIRKPMPAGADVAEVLLGARELLVEVRVQVVRTDSMR